MSRVTVSTGHLPVMAADDRTWDRRWHCQNGSRRGVGGVLDGGEHSADAVGESGSPERYTRHCCRQREDNMTKRPMYLQHVNVYVRNVERSKKWYEELL